MEVQEELKRLIRSNSVITSSETDDITIRNAGSVISAIEHLVDIIIQIDDEDTRSDLFGFLTEQEFAEFKEQCFNVSEKVLNLAQELNDELFHYLKVRADENEDYRGKIEFGPMGDI